MKNLLSEKQKQQEAHYRDVLKGRALSSHSSSVRSQEKAVFGRVAKNKKRNIQISFS